MFLYLLMRSSSFCEASVFSFCSGRGSSNCLLELRLSLVSLTVFYLMPRAAALWPKRVRWMKDGFLVVFLSEWSSRLRVDC